MTFRLRDDARQYFKAIETYSKSGSFEHMWDPYYLCFMVGANELQRGEEPAGTTEFSKEFIHKYRDSKNEILATLVMAEIRRQDISPDDEPSVRREMLRLLEPNAVTNLSPDGHKVMNRYADGGFDRISQDIPDPRDFASFLMAYYERYCEG